MYIVETSMDLTVVNAAFMLYAVVRIVRERIIVPRVYQGHLFLSAFFVSF